MLDEATCPLPSHSFHRDPLDSRATVASKTSHCSPVLPPLSKRVRSGMVEAGSSR